MCLNVEQNTQEPGGGEVSEVSSIRSHRAGGKGFRSPRVGCGGCRSHLGPWNGLRGPLAEGDLPEGVSHPAEADAENTPGSASILLMSPTFSNTMKYKG